MAKQYNVTLVKSLTGRHDKHIATAHSLGLRRIGDKTAQPDNPQTLGKLHQIRYLVKVTEQEAVKAEKTAKSVEKKAEKPLEAKTTEQEAAKTQKPKAASRKQEVKE